eukprot:scaffold384032_cov36-Prasinocladus_malaysianus.AAC.2
MKALFMAKAAPHNHLTTFQSTPGQLRSCRRPAKKSYSSLIELLGLELHPLPLPWIRFTCKNLSSFTFPTSEVRIFLMMQKTIELFTGRLKAKKPDGLKFVSS